MVQSSQFSEVSSPKALAGAVGVVGATFAVVLVLVFMVPLTAFELVDGRDIAFVTIGTAIWAFSVCFLFMMLRHANKRLELTMKTLANLRGMRHPVRETGLTTAPIVEGTADDDLGDDWLRIDAHKRVRLTDGITKELLAKLAAASLPAISQRTLDAAGVVTRDPAVAVNAKVLVSWLRRNDFIKLIGNSRHEYTPLGRSLLRTVSGTSSTPPPTTTRSET